MLSLVFSTFSCGEEAEWPISDNSLVSVYQVSEIVGSNNPFKLELFKNKPLTILFSTPSKAVAYENISYVDNSSDTDFDIVVSGVIKTVNGGPDEGKQVEIIIAGSRDLIEVQDKDESGNLLFDDSDPPQAIMVKRHIGSLTVNHMDNDGNIESSDVFNEFLVEDTEVYN